MPAALRLVTPSCDYDHGLGSPASLSCLKARPCVFCTTRGGDCMALRDSTTGKAIRQYSIEELEDAADLMRGHDLVALHAAGSGHAGGTLSIMDITAAVYLKVACHDPKNPNWPDRDRIIWSTGHKAPSLYLGLAFAGFCPPEEVVTLRKLSSPYQGHPHWLKLHGDEA